VSRAQRANLPTQRVASSRVQIFLHVERLIADANCRLDSWTLVACVVVSQELCSNTSARPFVIRRSFHPTQRTQRMYNENHVLHPLLPDRNEHGYELRHRRHELTLSLLPVTTNETLFTDNYTKTPTNTPSPFRLCITHIVQLRLVTSQ